MNKNKTYLLVASLLLIAFTSWAQQPPLQYFTPNNKNGLNVFENPKDSLTTFEGVKVRVGGAFAMQFQGLHHENDAENLVEIESNFNLPTANLDLDVQLYSGVRMHLRTYLSSRHHSETYVKGGYLQIDKLDFVKRDFLSDFMNKATFRIGQMEINYGDAHYRRTDNGHALFNPFVGNYLMDAFTTEIAFEFYYQSNGWIGMGGLSNGRLNQSVSNTTSKGALYGKLGYDKQISDDLRVRLTGSLYYVKNTSNIYLYGGDRAGARYYQVMDVDGGSSNDFSGRINPGFKTDMTAIMINPFVKYKGFEFFGIFESSSGRDDVADAAFSGNRSWTQLAGEALYRFGSKEQLYVGARYNMVTGQLAGEETDKVKVDRINFGGGWFMTKNILAKVEYVAQNYKDYPPGQYEGGKFDGIMIEAVIAF